MEVFATVLGVAILSIILTLWIRGPIKIQLDLSKKSIKRLRKFLEEEDAPEIEEGNGLAYMQALTGSSAIPNALVSSTRHEGLPDCIEEFKRFLAEDNPDINLGVTMKVFKDKEGVFVLRLIALEKPKEDPAQ